MSQPVLVTGASGFAGSHLVERLTASGVEVVAWRHRRLATVAGHDSRVTWTEVEIDDPRAVGRAIADARPSRIVHCAGAAHVGRSWDHTQATLAANVRGTHHLLEALRVARVEARLVIPSSAMVYRTSVRALTEDDPLVPASPYGISKLAQEMLALRAAADGLSVVVARAFNHVGPRQDPSFAASSFARQIAQIEMGRRTPEIVVGNLDSRRDLTDVRDTVRAYHLMLSSGTAGSVYNVCSGDAVVIRDLLDRMIARARVRVEVRVDPALYRPNDIPVVVGDPTRARRELGWTPTIPLEQTIDDLLDYWRQLI